MSGANIADITEAPALLDHAPGAGAVIADKGYDANTLVERINAAGAEAIIPPRSNRKTPRPYDTHRYKARNLVERFFNQLKQFRRIAAPETAAIASVHELDEHRSAALRIERIAAEVSRLLALWSRRASG